MCINNDGISHVRISYVEIISNPLFGLVYSTNYVFKHVYQCINKNKPGIANTMG